jgi:DNA modification methylase
MNVVHFGDCRDTMRAMIAQGVKVQMCVTSPPYFGLRSYGIGAENGEIGLEQTPDEYVAAMVEVFSLVWDLLADDGVLWLNLGDSYFSNTKGTGGSNPATSSKQAWEGAENGQAFPKIRLSAGDTSLKPKDLIGIPWRVAFALQEAGWYLRQDIIWHKPNPMPESVIDRCTKAHEYLFLLSKRERYYFDSAAIAEPATHAKKVVTLGDKSMSKGQANGMNIAPSGNGAADQYVVAEIRNKRSVWTVATTPYSGAHFATFPPALIEPCILAGSRPGDVVLDPFFGSGTTGQVAQKLGRQWIGCELNPAYGELQKERTAQDAFVFA